MATIRNRTKSDGTKAWFVEIRKKGHPPQRATFRRRTNAEKWARDTESDIERGRYFQTLEAKRHTLADLIDCYTRDTLPHKKAKTQGPQRQQLAWWKAELGDYTLADCTPALIAEARDKLALERGPATVVRYLAVLSHAFTVAAKEWGWIESNPCLKVRKPTEPRGRVRFLSDSEREGLLRECRTSKNLWLHTAVVVALSTGMRKGELMGLTWKDVDLQAGRIVLQETKNGERRVVPLAGSALALLKEHTKVRRLDTDLLFPGARKDTPIDLRTPFENALKRAGIEDFRWHDLRHSTASYLAMNGASLAEIAEVLGHKTLNMVKRYAHLSEAHTAGVVERMNARIFGEG